MTTFKAIILYLAIGICIARFARWLDKVRDGVDDGDYYVSVAVCWPLAVVILGRAASSWSLCRLGRSPLSNFCEVVGA